MSHFELRASRVLGSERQLWNDCEEDLPDTYILRPSDTRSQYEYAKTLSSDSVQCVLNAHHGSVPRINGNMTCEEFQALYPTEDTFVPLLATGCCDCEWLISSLTNILGHERRLEVAQADATVSVQEYVNYLESDEVKSDDNPVLIFETLVTGEHDCVIDRYAIPPAFCGMSMSDPTKPQKSKSLQKNSANANANANDNYSSGSGSNRNCGYRGCHTPGDEADLLSAADAEGLAFGLHRWLIIGPKNSGSNIHIDPLGTSAWNMLLSGTKLWVCFPNDIDESLLKSTENQLSCCSSGTSSTGTNTNTNTNTNTIDPCAAGWFANMLTNLPEHVYNRRIQFLQQVGETVFIPEGYWHAVLNITTTIAVTQNIAHPNSYKKVSCEVYKSDADSADIWRNNIITKGLNPQRGPRKDSKLHMNATSHCVHCGSFIICSQCSTGADTSISTAGTCTGNIYTMYSDRPVCSQCETDEKYRHMYDLIDANQAERKYGNIYGISDFAREITSLLPSMKIKRKNPNSSLEGVHHECDVYAVAHVLELAEELQE